MSVDNDSPEGDRLPLRWAVILLVAGAAGIGVGSVTNLGMGVATAIAIIGLLHTILP